MKYSTIALVIVFLLHFCIEASTLECYRCSGSSRNANKADKACVYGYSTLKRQKCPDDDYVCTTYQYEVSIHGLIKSSVTIRGCQPYDYVEDCKELLNELRDLLYPARVRELDCHTCKTNLCNTNSKI